MADARPEGFRWRAFCPLGLSVGIPFLTQLIDKPPLWIKPLTRAPCHYLSRRFLSIENLLDGSNPQSAAALQTWLQEMISIHSTFLNVVLRGSVLVPLSQQHVPPQERCRIPMLDRGVLQVVGSYLGLVTGQELRNVQEVGAVFAVVLDQE